jgi:hypothetical protein
MRLVIDTSGMTFTVAATPRAIPPVRNGLATILYRPHLRRRWTLTCPAAC